MLKAKLHGGANLGYEMANFARRVNLGGIRIGVATFGVDFGESTGAQIRQTLGYKLRRTGANLTQRIRVARGGESGR